MKFLHDDEPQEIIFPRKTCLLPRSTHELFLSIITSVYSWWYPQAANLFPQEGWCAKDMLAVLSLTITSWKEIPLSLCEVENPFCCTKAEGTQGPHWITWTIKCILMKTERKWKKRKEGRWLIEVPSSCVDRTSYFFRKTNLTYLDKS